LYRVEKRALLKLFHPPDGPLAGFLLHDPVPHLLDLPILIPLHVVGLPYDPNDSGSHCGVDPVDLPGVPQFLAPDENVLLQWRYDGKINFQVIFPLFVSSPILFGTLFQPGCIQEHETILS
jgi:hypothetical protein